MAVASAEAAVLGHRMTSVEDAMREHRSDMKEQREDIRALTGAVAELGKSVAVLAERVGSAASPGRAAEPEDGLHPHVRPAAIGGGVAAAVAAIYEAARYILSVSNP